MADLSVMVNIDGGARGNPGPAGAGAVLRDASDGQTLFEGGWFLGRATNNVAEYTALVEALKVAALLGAHEVDVVSDSELLVRQMNGIYRVKNAGLKPLFEEACRLASQFATCTYRHTRRENNADADRLANQAMNAKRHVEGAAGLQ